MTRIAEGTRITLRNILYLTDFSEPSEAALPFAVAIARDYGANVYALHVLTPVIRAAYAAAIHADEQLAHDEMTKVESRLAGVAHDTGLAQGIGIWPAVEQAIHERSIDLIVLGTHGRAHLPKLLLGSCAEEILRRSSVPVLTVGPHVLQDLGTSGAFHSVLFATDFGKPCEAAAPFAVSLAEENDARLILLYVAPKPETNEQSELALGNLTQRLEDIVPSDARRWCHPSAIVEYGDAADRILAAAIEHGADIIVLGVRDAAKHLGAATHLERATAHNVIVHARCAVLTVRG